jgi:hypothetical protein
VYLGAEGKLGGEARDRIAGFWRALGLVPPAEPDHLAALLGLYAELAERGAPAAWRRALLWEHLLSWTPLYLAKLQALAPPFYRRWGELLREALDAEGRALGAQKALPLHLREAPGLADPRASSSEEFLTTLLAPARSGLVLVRDDLARAARELGTGLRAGERAFALRSLFGQDASATLEWLASEADAWASLHARRKGVHGRVAEWWAARARSTAKLLRELSADADAAFRKV